MGVLISVGRLVIKLVLNHLFGEQNGMCDIMMFVKEHYDMLVTCIYIVLPPLVWIIYVTLDE
jgi:hypothetical protein